MFSGPTQTETVANEMELLLFNTSMMIDQPASLSRGDPRSFPIRDLTRIFQRVYNDATRI